MTLRRRLARAWEAFNEPDEWGKCPEHHSPDAPEDCSAADCHLDPGIYELVWGLTEAGIETLWSCQGRLTGGSAHGYLKPTIAVGLNEEETGPRARDVAMKLGMPLLWLHRVECTDRQVLAMRDVPAPNFWWDLVFDPWVKWERLARQPSEER